MSREALKIYAPSGKEELLPKELDHDRLSPLAVSSLSGGALSRV
jgi:hypothetical protein